MYSMYVRMYVCMYSMYVRMYVCMYSMYVQYVKYVHVGMYSMYLCMYCMYFYMYSMYLCNVMYVQYGYTVGMYVSMYSMYSMCVCMYVSNVYMYCVMYDCKQAAYVKALISEYTQINKRIHTHIQNITQQHTQHNTTQHNTTQHNTHTHAHRQLQIAGPRTHVPTHDIKKRVCDSKLIVVASEGEILTHPLPSHTRHHTHTSILTHP